MPAESGVSTRHVFPLSVLLLAIVTVLVAGWGAAAPYAGPDFGFVADRATAWTWSETSAVLALAPGAIAFVCGLIVIGASARATFRRRLDFWVLGLIVAACGAWFVVGQYVWRVIDGRSFIAPSGAYHFMWKELAFAIGPGVILVFCGAVMMGWGGRRAVAVVAERYPRAMGHGVTGAGTRPVAAVPGTMAPAGETMAPPAAAGTGVVERPVAERVVDRPAGTAGVGRHAAATGAVVERPAATAPVVERPAGTAPVVERPAAGTAPVVERPAAGTAPVVERPAGTAPERWPVGSTGVPPTA